jgi:hypothetical protein
MKRSFACALGLVVALPPAANAATLTLAGPASPYDEMIHNNDAPDGTTLTLITKPSAYLIDYTSSDTLSAAGSGNGFAIVTGPFSDITLDPQSPVIGFTDIQYTLRPVNDPGREPAFTYDILVNFVGGGMQSFTDVLFPNNHKFDINAEGNEVIESLTFSGLEFNGQSYDFDSLRQVSINAVIPEPASWAMMITGFGLVGGAIRRRRSGGRIALA